MQQQYTQQMRQMEQLRHEISQLSQASEEKEAGTLDMELQMVRMAVNVRKLRAEVDETKPCLERFVTYLLQKVENNEKKIRKFIFKMIQTHFSLYIYMYIYISIYVYV